MGGGSDNTIEIGVEATGVDQFQNQMGAAGGALQGLRKNALIAGAALAGIAGIAASGIKRLIGQARDIETAFAEVTTLLGEGEDAAELYGDEVAELSTRFAAHGGQVEVVEGLYQAISASMGEGAEVTEFMAGAMQFGTAALVDTRTAVDVLSTVINAYSMEAEDAESVSDVLFTTIQRGKTTGEELAPVLGRVIPIAAELGVQFEEVGGAVATLTRGGLDTAEAVTAIRAAMTQMMRPTTEAQAAIEKLGYESGQAMVKEEGLAGALNLLREESERTGVPMTDMFTNVRAITAVLPLAGEHADAFAEDVAAMRDSAGTTERAFETMAETTDFQLRQAMQRLTVVTDQLGQAFLTALLPAIKFGIDVIERFAAWWDNLGGEMQQTVANVIIATTAITGIIGTALLASVALAAIPTALIGIGAASGVMAGLVASNFGSVHDRVLSIRDSINTELKPTMQALSQTADVVLGTFRGAFDRHLGGAESRVAGFGNTVALHIEQGVKNTLREARYRLYQFRTAWEDNSDAIDAAIDSMVERVSGGMATIQAHLGPVVSFLSDVFKETFASAFGSAAAVGRTLFDVIGDLGVRFGLFRDDTTTTAEVLGQLLDPFRKVEFVVTGLKDAVGTLASAWDTDLGSVRTTTETVTARVGELFGGMESDSELTFAGIKENAETQLLSTFDRIGEKTTALSELWARDFGDMAVATGGTFARVGVLTSEVLGPAIALIPTLVDNHLGRMMELVDIHLGDLIAEFMQTVTHIHVNVIQPILEGIIVLWRIFGDEILTIVELAFDAISLVITNVLDVILTGVRVFLALLRGDWRLALSLVFDLTKRLFGRMYDFFTGWGDRVIEWLGGLVGGIIDWFKNLYQRLVGGSIVPDMLADMFAAFTGWGADTLRFVAGFFGDTVAAFKKGLGIVFGVVTGALTKVLNAFKTAFRLIKSAVTTGFGGVKEKFSTGVTNALKVVTNAKSKFKTAGRDLIKAVGEGVKASAGAVKDRVEGAIDKITGLLPSSDADEGPLSDLTGAGAAIPETIAAGMDPSVLAEAASRMVARVRAALAPLTAGGVPLALDGAIGAGDGRGSDGPVIRELHVHANSREEGRDAARGFTQELRAIGFNNP